RSGGDGHSCPLQGMFEALEQVLAMLKLRRQQGLLSRVQGPVEGVCGRSFTRHHLGQILHVYP
ncbi:unnamed protein product, partial [Discosporangium mesarthrocarpum]